MDYELGEAIEIYYQDRLTGAKHLVYGELLHTNKSCLTISNWESSDELHHLEELRIYYSEVIHCAIPDNTYRVEDLI